MECVPCAAGSYQPFPGQLRCEACSAYQLGRSSREGATTCAFCEDGLYLAADPAAGAFDFKDCFACPSHATCFEGATLATMELDKGYWRTSSDSPKLKECAVEGACRGGNASSCAEGYHKTMCAICEPDHYREVATGACLACDGSAARRSFVLYLILVVFMLSLLVVAVVALRRILRRAVRRACEFEKIIPDAAAPALAKGIQEALAAAPAPATDVPEALAAAAATAAKVPEAAAAAAADVIAAAAEGAPEGAAARVCIRGVPLAVADEDVMTAVGDATRRRVASLRRMPEAVLVTLAAGAGALPATVRIDDATYDLAWLPPEVEFLAGFEAADSQGESFVELVLREIMASLTVKLKIVVVFLQSMCYLPTVFYGVKWPRQLLRVLRFFDFLNLDVFNLLFLECSFGRLTFYDRLLFVTLLPISISTLLLLAATRAHRRGRDLRGNSRSRRVDAAALRTRNRCRVDAAALGTRNRVASTPWRWELETGVASTPRRPGRF